VSRRELVSLLLVSPIFVSSLLVSGARGQDRTAEIRRMILDAGRALQEGSAPRFVSYFALNDPVAAGRLRSGVSALFAQKDVAVSIEVQRIEASGDGFDAEANWLLQLTPRDQPGAVERRQEQVRMRIADNAKGKPRIVAFEPLELLEPMP